MAIILLISTCGYFVNATTNWFTGFPLKNKYQTLNATAYIENAIPEDAAAIRWLNKNITGQPTVLEACGDSYKDYDNRVSAMTGLPTVLDGMFMNGYGEIILMKKTKEEQTWKLFILQQIKKKYRNCLKNMR